MKVTISRTTEYTKDDVPVESFDLEVSTIGGDIPHEVADTYLKLRDKLNKAIKEETK